eukprot:5415276-Prymnesium_polylepis.1
MGDDLDADDIFAQLRDLQGNVDAADAAGVASFIAPIPPIPMPPSNPANGAAQVAGQGNVDVMQGPLSAPPQAALTTAAATANLMGQFMPIAAMQAQIQAAQMGASSVAPLPPLPQAGAAPAAAPNLVANVQDGK